MASSNPCEDFLNTQGSCIPPMEMGKVLINLALSALYQQKTVRFVNLFYDINWGPRGPNGFTLEYTCKGCGKRNLDRNEVLPHPETNTFTIIPALGKSGVPGAARTVTYSCLVKHLGTCKRVLFPNSNLTVENSRPNKRSRGSDTRETNSSEQSTTHSGTSTNTIVPSSSATDPPTTPWMDPVPTGPTMDPELPLDFDFTLLDSGSWNCGDDNH